jgi:hypothetical protein
MEKTMKNKLIVIALILSSCQAPDMPKPAKLQSPNYVRGYQFNVQPSGASTFPKYIPVIK